MDKVAARKIVLSDEERAGLTWVKAQASGVDGQCVEVASAAGRIAVRDSKDPEGPILVYASSEFRAFLHGVRNGEFDHLMRLFF